MAATAAPRSARAERNARALAKAREAQRARTAPATRPARRKSGPVPRPAAPPRRQKQQSLVVRLVHGRAAGVLDGLLRGRAWIVLVGVLLVGIVFLNVSVLQLNRGIARTDAQSAALERANSGLRGRVARLDSAERIQSVAQQHGFVMPQPGDITYLTPNPRADARLAAKRIVPPAPQQALQPTAPPPATTLPSASPPAASPPAASPAATTTPHP